MQDSLRAFIAIELTQTLQYRINNILSVLKTSEADIRWVKPENIHLTLKFLGQIPRIKIGTIAQILEKIAASNSPFTLKLHSLGTFPPRHQPRVVWVGVNQGERQTQELSAAIEHQLMAIGFPKEKRAFSPHITLGRIKGPRNIHQLLQNIQNYPLPDNLNQFVDSVSLIQSTLTSQGSVYDVLANIKLKGTS